jgi:hypothetical protein
MVRGLSPTARGDALPLGCDQRERRDCAALFLGCFESVEVLPMQTEYLRFYRLIP